MQRTLIILKPDAIQRGLVGRIITRFEEKGLHLVAVKFLIAPEPLLEKHYEVHKGKPFYEKLVSFMGSSPVLAMVWEGVGAVAICRNMMGATFGSKADPGTIRGDFGVSNSFNLIHGSDSEETASFEINLWFNAEELAEWNAAQTGWVYDYSGAEPE